MNAMVTPSPVCTLPLRRTSDLRCRKKASPNIFQDIKLFQLQHLFMQTGDAQAEERARIVWERGDAREAAEVLMKLKDKKRVHLFTHWLHEHPHEFASLLWIKAFNKSRYID
ncbi:arginine vasopressin-induced protein 1-like [Latimeria chalumnae]|uniref:arginine vasopressin-induced protein 1-like n=1 Tax=Latimeria chalumnae TaxID=7897 RepID=UPI00313CE746